MQVALNMNERHRDYYGIKLLISLLLLLLILAYTSFYLIQNYYSKSFLEYSLSGKKIYFLESDNLKNMYEENEMDYEEYKNRVKKFKNLCKNSGYTSMNIKSSALPTIDKSSKLIVLDMMSLSTEEIDNIDKFVMQGGKIIFNYTSGFLDDSLRYKKNNLVKQITKLEIDRNINSVKPDSNASRYISTKLLSPISQYLLKGQALDLNMYDNLPIFDTKNNLVADAYLTNWTQTNYLNKNRKKELTQKQSGVIWHGYKGKGKWVYFSFPSYVFIDIDKKLYAKLFKGMLEYLDRSIIPVIYPYIDAKNVVFVSEDTEYKFENLEQFYNVSQKNRFPVTAFCVANLANEHKELMKKVAKSKYMEIGSHSYTHKKIVGESDGVYKKETIGSKILLKKLTHQEIYGFRPPREEIDEKMIDLLQDGGFKYILTAGDNLLYPYFNANILMIPRHGTDDYSYLINLDWDSAEILQQMEKEVNELSALNGIYTMSTHTHLMSFSSNINITDKFFQYVNAHKYLTPMNGKMLYDRVSQRDKIKLQVKTTVKKVIMQISNNNDVEVKNLHYTLFVDPNVKITNVDSEIIGIKTELIKIKPSKYTLIIKSLKPRSQIVLFLNYEKNI